MSIPLWNEEAKAVGDDLFPNLELSLVYPGIGHTNLLELKYLEESVTGIWFDAKLFEDKTTGEKNMIMKIEMIIINE